MEDVYKRQSIIRASMPSKGLPIAEMCIRDRGYGVAKNEAKAEEEFKKAVSQSITLYYYYDSVSTGENLSLIHILSGRHPRPARLTYRRFRFPGTYRC